MRPLPDGVKLRKVETPKHEHHFTASYAVLLHGDIIGRVHKVIQPRGNRATAKRMVTVDMCWGWDRPGVPEDPCGYDTRRDAVDALLRSLNVPRETSTPEGDPA